MKAVEYSVDVESVGFGSDLFRIEVAGGLASSI